MTFKLITKKFATLGLALLMADAGSVLAATLTTVNGAASSSCSYSSFSSDSNGNLTVSCNSSQVHTTPIGQVPQCSLTSSLSSIVKGGTANLMVSCSPVATSYNWTNTGVATTVSSTISVSPIATTTYTVVGRNAAGAGNTATFTLSVTTPVVVQLTAVQKAKQWIYAFETINALPHDLKSEPIHYMEYLKRIQAGKPLHYRLPQPSDLK